MPSSAHCHCRTLTILNSSGPLVTGMSAQTTSKACCKEGARRDARPKGLCCAPLARSCNPVARWLAGRTKSPSWLICLGCHRPILFFACSNGLVTSMAFFVIFVHFLVSLVPMLLAAPHPSLRSSLLPQSLIAALIFLASSLDAIVL